MSDENTSRRWNVRPIPTRARWWVLSFDTSRPSRTTLPDVGVITPQIALNVVVLPAPFGPMSPQIRPPSTRSDTPPTAR